VIPPNRVGTARHIPINVSVASDNKQDVIVNAIDVGGILSDFSIAAYC
jgi:hypothetical protein